MPTYAMISSYTVSGSSVANIDFNGISQNYTDIVAVCSLRGTQTATTTTLLSIINANRGNIYDGIVLKGDGSSGTSARWNFTDGTYYYAPAGTMTAASAASNTFSNHIINYFGYSLTNVNKQFVARSNNPNTITEAVVNRYFYDIAITRLTFYPAAGNFDVGSKITLYGIKAG